MPMFPKVIYVHWDESNNEPPWLAAETTIERTDHGEKVAIYELKEVKTKKIVESLI